MQSDARASILAGIRKALAAERPGANAEAEWCAIPREYRRGSSMDQAELEQLFTDRLRDYGAQVLNSSTSDVTETLGRVLTGRGVSRLLIPRGFQVGRLPEGFDFVSESSLTASEMNLCEGVVTESSLAIAQTGTIVLQSLPGQGSRAASLVPDYHLCLVEASRIVATVPEAIVALHRTAALPTTFISGPSATADIEMTRIQGVHGPRFLDVILIAG